jgi:hypothetical protein
MFSEEYMRSKKIKTVTGYKALSLALGALGLSDHALDEDVLKEVPRGLEGHPYTPYTYGPTIAFWKGNDGRYFAWPEISQRKYEIHELVN